jgi:hypothetical protein
MLAYCALRAILHVAILRATRHTPYQGRSIVLMSTCSHVSREPTNATLYRDTRSDPSVSVACVLRTTSLHLNVTSNEKDGRLLSRSATLVVFTASGQLGGMPRVVS